MKFLCFDISYVGFNRPEWKTFALEGQIILAIKSLRNLKNKDFPNVDDPRRLGLKEAKETVEAYMKKHKVPNIGWRS